MFLIKLGPLFGKRRLFYSQDSADFNSLPTRAGRFQLSYGHDSVDFNSLTVRTVWISTLLQSGHPGLQLSYRQDSVDINFTSVRTVRI